MNNVGRWDGHLTDRQFAAGYDAGFTAGYFQGLQDGFAKGYDEGTEALAAELRGGWR
jgi:hypothetical protein